MADAIGPHVKHGRSDPCPQCGNVDRKCITFLDTGAVLCLFAPNAEDRRTQSGIGWLHRTHGPDWRDQVFPASPPRDTGPDVPPPDPAVLDRGFRLLLDGCPLAPAHRDELRRRGLPDGMIDALPVGSLPEVGGERDRIAADLIATLGDAAYGTLPGLYREKDGTPALAGYSGLLIATTDATGRLMGFQVRPDDADARAQGKYRWLSSKDKTGGVGSGAPCGVVFPVSWIPGAPIGRVLVTEGILKGQVVANRTGLPTVAMPGASITADVPRLLAELGATEIVLAFDADRETNPLVALAERQLTETLIAAGLTVMRATWPAQHKGLDDALAAGVMPLIEPHPAAIADLSHCSAEVAQLQRELATERQRYDKLHDLHVAMVHAHRAPHLGPERTAATAIVLDLARSPRGEWQKMPAKRVAENAGVSERAVPRQMEKIKPLLADAGVVEFKKVWMPEAINPQTGQVSGGHHLTHARLVAEPVAALHVIAAAMPKTGHKNGNGGVRPCERCGGTSFTRYIVDKCDGCGQVAKSQKIRMDAGNRQTGGTPPDTFVAPAVTDTASPESPFELISPEDVLNGTVLATSHNDEPAWLADAPDPEDAGEGKHAEPPGLTGPLTASDRVAERRRLEVARADHAARTRRAETSDLAPPPFEAVRTSLAAADRAGDPMTRRQAQDDMRARLETYAVAHGRTPVPKPTASPLPHMPTDRPPPDRWTP